MHVERSEPEGLATVGQTIYFAGNSFSRNLHFSFKVEEVNLESYQLGMHVFFPYGLHVTPPSPHIPSMRPPGASNMPETSSSHQDGEVSFSKYMVPQQSLGA